MIKTTALLATASAILIMAAAPAAQAKVEEPKYQVVQSFNRNIDIRQYGSRLAAEVELPGSLDDARNTGFRALADYVFGKNVPNGKTGARPPVLQTLSKQASGQPNAGQPNAHIPMTAPVTIQDDHGVWKIRFYMPVAYTMDTIPKPADARIKLITLPPQKFAAIRFSGGWNEDNFDKKAMELKKFLAEKNISTTGEIVKAHYNPPWTPVFMRHNEVLISVN